MSLRSIIFHNFGLKLFSIALGTVIWMGVHYSIEHDFNLDEPGPGQVIRSTTLNVPVTEFLRPDDKRTFKISPSSVLLTVIAESQTLQAERKNIKIYVDLTDFHSSNSLQEVLHEDVPRGVAVLGLKPSSVTVEPIPINP